MKTGDKFNPYRVFVGSFIPNALMEYEGLSSTAKLCWARLAQYAGKDGICYPAQVTLSGELGISLRHLRRVLVELESKGFIRRTHPTGQERFQHKTIRYEFLWHDIFVTCAQDVNVRSPEDVNVRSVVRGTVVRESQKDGTTLAQSRKDLASPLVVPPELADLELYKIDAKLCKAWPKWFAAAKATFQAVDVLLQVREAHHWELSNPEKQKKVRTRFLHKWLSTAQDRGPGQDDSLKGVEIW